MSPLAIRKPWPWIRLPSGFWASRYWIRSPTAKRRCSIRDTSAPRNRAGTKATFRPPSSSTRTVLSAGSTPVTVPTAPCEILKTLDSLWKVRQSPTW